MSNELDENCISILGAGNGGHAFATYAKERGFSVKIWNRSKLTIDMIQKNEGISATGLIEGHYPVDIATCSIKEAIQDSQLIMIVTPANAHKEIAQKIAPYLEEDQIVMLNPGRTGGALEVSNAIKENKGPFKPKIVEAQSLLFVARSPKPARVHIAGIKRKLPVAAFPASFTEEIMPLLNDLHLAFWEAETVLNTSFDNIGAIFHPGPLLLNAARCENPKVTYRHYIDGITPTIASFLEKMDEERVGVANAYGVTAISLKNWLNVVYGSEGTDLHETIQNTVEYHDVIAPTSLDVRYVFEDVPTGLVPLSSLGVEVGIPTPHIDVVVSLANCLLNTNYYKTGRTIESMGLTNIPSYLLKEYVTLGDDFYIDIRIQESVLEE
jgi:opine dehydrogenase